MCHEKNIMIPENFPYRELLLKGRPVHERTDAFRLRHPAMDPAKRAKIFAPFDALKGFKEAILKEEARQAAFSEGETVREAAEDSV